MNDTGDAIEVEWQFETHDLDRVRRWIGSQRSGASFAITRICDAEQVDAYYDTADWRIWLSGFSFRRRHQGDGYELTLKSLERPAGGPVARRELNEPSIDGAVPAASGPVSDRVRTIAGRRVLHQLFEVRTRRRTYALESAGKRLAVAALDETTIVPPGASPRTTHRVEVELTGSETAPALVAFVEAMAHACDLRPARASKFETGLEAAAYNPGHSRL